MCFKEPRVLQLTLFSLLCISSCLCFDDIDDYYKQRAKILRAAHQDAIGGKLRFLTHAEEFVNRKLMFYKNEEFEEGVKNLSNFLASQHFFTVKDRIDKSSVFRLIQKLPKGASLHSHDLALVSDDYVFNNITFRDNLYAKEDPNNHNTIRLVFSRNDPGFPWKPISSLRQEDETFDRRLKHQLTLYRNNPEEVYGDTNNLWKAFENIFKTVAPLLTYKPVFRDYFYQALQELYDDNVKYLEFRGLLPTLYDLEGNTYGPEDIIQIYYETSREFMKDHPEFWGVRFIFAPHRVVNDTIMNNFVDFMYKVVEKYPDFVVGFDLVGHEDPGPPLKEFIPSLLQLKNVTKFFFHAGETTWNGLRVDENLVDAVLLNSSRIGHGYAVLKHPVVLQMVKEKQIAIEICPISNQVLGLVKDLRNHPANFLIANDYPVVIAPDDPGLWGAKALSYDWYMAFMGMSSRHADLRLLKKLAINSIRYSSMREDVKEQVLKEWAQDWNQFIQDIFYEENFVENV